MTSLTFLLLWRRLAVHVADQPPRQLICTDNEGDLLTGQQSTPSSSPSSQTLGS